MRAAHSWLGPDGQCASIAGSRGVFCEKGLHGPVAADPQGDSYVQQLACEEGWPFSRYLLNLAARDCAAAHEQKPERPLRLSAKGPKIGIGGSLAAPPLPHHRTYGSVYGGSRSYANALRSNDSTRVGWAFGFMHHRERFDVFPQRLPGFTRRRR